MTARPTLYPGQYFDAETGLHQNYFRDYDPKTGKYIQADLIGLVGSY
jgi:RHS repeat-associated protein